MFYDVTNIFCVVAWPGARPLRDTKTRTYALKSLKRHREAINLFMCVEASLEHEVIEK